MHDSDELDLMIDRALASYADDAGDDEQLVERVTMAARRQAAQHRAAQRRWLPWAAGLAAAACALAVIVGGLRHKQPVNDPPPRAQIARKGSPVDSSPLAALSSATSAQQAHPGARARQQARPVTVSEPLPKLEVFPTPEPLPEPERAFAVYVQHAPPTEVRELEQAQVRANRPVTIEALTIQPLKPLDDGGR